MQTKSIKKEEIGVAFLTKTQSEVFVLRPRSTSDTWRLSIPTNTVILRRRELNLK